MSENAKKHKRRRYQQQDFEQLTDVVRHNHDKSRTVSIHQSRVNRETEQQAALNPWINSTD